jgi:hypothetical protein
MDEPTNVPAATTGISAPARSAYLRTTPAGRPRAARRVLSEGFLDAVEGSGRTRVEISADSGIPRQVLSRRPFAFTEKTIDRLRKVARFLKFRGAIVEDSLPVRHYKRRDVHACPTTTQCPRRRGAR